jgi:hypothetical protein
VLRYDNRKFGGGKEECLIAKETRNPDKGHRPAMAAKFRKCISFGDAICVPSHDVFAPES